MGNKRWRTILAKDCKEARRGVVEAQQWAAGISQKIKRIWMDRSFFILFVFFTRIVWFGFDLREKISQYLSNDNKITPKTCGILLLYYI